MDRLSEIRARCERATPVVFVDVPIRAETRVFLEHAKSDMTHLLAEVERLNQQLNSAKIGWDTYKRYSAELADRAKKAEAAQKVLIGGCDYYGDRSQKWENTAKEWAEENKKLTARAEKAEAANRWIPVSERQPKTEDAVRGMIEVWDERDGPDTMSIDFYWEWETNVTHWRPLPEPPKEGE